jgi:holo-[acyl-carrier protein] synthase
MSGPEDSRGNLPAPPDAAPRPASRTGRFATGIDLIEIERIRRALRRPGFRERCFTPVEREYCDARPNPAESYAARFAGKEAVGKALGCGPVQPPIALIGRSGCRNDGSSMP